MIKVGDIVVVHSDEKRRGFWNLGKIEELIVGRDDEIRGAIVRVYTGQRKSKLLRRPLQRLYPIKVGESAPAVNTPAREGEVEEGPKDDELEQKRLRNIDSQTESESRRPRRIAAVKARDKILAQAMN